MVSFRGQKKLGPRPDRSPLRVKFKISDEHPHPFHMRSLPPGILFVTRASRFNIESYFLHTKKKQCCSKPFFFN